MSKNKMYSRKIIPQKNNLDNLTAENLLNKMASDLGVKVVRWSTVDEAIEKNISFAKIVDNTYISEKDRIIIEAKSKIW